MGTCEPLRPGEPVTLVLPDHIVQVEVTYSTRVDFVCRLTSRSSKTYDSSWTLDEEGVGWLRGYYQADSPEVQACRTAQALAEKRQIPGPPPLPYGPMGSSFIPTPYNAGIGISGGSSISIDEKHIADVLDKHLKKRGL